MDAQRPTPTAAATVGGGDVVLALLAYVPVLFLVPLLSGRKKRFVEFHTRQGTYLFMIALGLFVLFAALFEVFVVKRVLDVFIVTQTLAVLVVLTFVGYVVVDLWMLVAVARKKMTMLPVLGELAGER